MAGCSKLYPMAKTTMTPEEQIEFDKCKDDPVYFYNKYCRKADEPEITAEKFEMMQILATNPWLMRSGRTGRGMTLNEMRRLTNRPLSYKEVYPKQNNE